MRTGKHEIKLQKVSKSKQPERSSDTIKIKTK